MEYNIKLLLIINCTQARCKIGEKKQQKCLKPDASTYPNINFFH